MDAIEKRARERARFDAWVKASGSYSWNGFNRMEDMWDAWQAALTPPEGYVLVDAKLLGAVRIARLAILQKQAEAEQMEEPHDASMWADCAADLDAIAPRGILAARPEVP